MADNSKDVIKGAKQCFIKKGEDGKAKVDNCIDGEYWSKNKLNNSKGYTKEVTIAENADFETVCERVDPGFEEGDESCLTQSVNKITTEDPVPERETVKGVTGYKFEKPSKIKKIESVHDILLPPFEERS